MFGIRVVPQCGAPHWLVIASAPKVWRFFWVFDRCRHPDRPWRIQGYVILYTQDNRRHEPQFPGTDMFGLAVAACMNKGRRGVQPADHEYMGPSNG